MNTKEKRYYYQWLLRTALGILCFASGIFAMMEVTFLRHHGTPFTKWVLLAAFSLVLMITGLNYMIDAVRFKIKLEKEKKRVRY